MEQDKKNQTGAPSSDTTSALFVSARKKQLEQQEADRRAREKEEQRQAAEAEVRRLEREVEERKRKAEEDARIAEEDARRIAEEARAKKAEAASNPDAVLGAAPQPKEAKMPKLPQMPKMPQPAAKPQGDAATAQKPGLNKNILIIGGVAIVVVIAVVLFLVLGNGGGRDSGGSADFGGTYISSQKGFDFAYPTEWVVDDASATNVVVTSPDLNGFLSIADVTSQINTFRDGGSDIISAAEKVITTMSQAVIGDGAQDAPPQLQKSGDYVSGSTEFTCDINGTESEVHISLEVIENRAILFMEAVETKNAKKFFPICEEIRMTLGVAAPDPAAETKEYRAVPDGFSRFTSRNGLTMVCPSGWGISDTDGGFSRPVVQIVAPGSSFMFVINYADEGKNLSGQDVYDHYVDQVIKLAKLDTKNIVNASAIGYEKFGEGLEEYYQSVDYTGNQKLYVSVVKFNDAAGNIQAIFMVYPASNESVANSMDTIMASIEAA